MKEVEKQYREDLGMWECVYKWGPLQWYVYKIRYGALLVFRRNIWKLKPKTAKYFIFRSIPKHELI